MQRSRRRKLQRMSLLSRGAPIAYAVAAITPNVAIAQSAEGLEEIVVTAQKRSESLQDVPLSIQAFTTQRLDELHVSSFDDFAKFMPSVSFTTGGPGFAKVYMRGVVSGGDGNHSGSQPSVGQYLDEQPITTIEGALEVHIYDIERVEALAGPQGTLYGASSQAGTIRIITNKPDTKAFSAGYDLGVNTVSHGDMGYTLEGFVNQPISDSAAVRLVGWYSKDGGYIDNKKGTATFHTFQTDGEGNVVGPVTEHTFNNDRVAKDNYNDVETYGARAALKIDLNDNWSVTPALMGQKQETNGVFGGDVKRNDLAVTHFFPEWSSDTWYQAALTVQGKVSNFDIVYAGAYLDRQADINSDYTDYATSYDAYYYNNGEYYAYCWSCLFTDNNGDYINPSQHINARGGFTKMSQEVRISYAGDLPLQWVAGAFYQRQQHNIEQRYMIDNLADAGEVTFWPDTFWLTEQIRIDQDKALFGQLTYTVGEKLDLTAGIRQYWSDNSLEGFAGFGLNNAFGSSTGENRCFSTKRVHGAPCTNLDKSTQDDGQTYRLNATYRLTADHMVYATWSTGFRPGGVNRKGDLPAYKPDYLTNYEVGWKTSWADNRLRFNGAIFREDWKDFQYAFLGENAFTQITNAAQATIDGIEVDVNWAATDNLTVGGGFAWLDAKLGENYCEEFDPVTNKPTTHCDQPNPPEFGGGAPKGQELPVTPKFKANLTARYTFQLGSFDSFVQGSAVYEGSRWADLRSWEREFLGKLDAYTLVDLSAGIAKGPYTAELFITNAFDSKAESDRGVQALESTLPTVYGFPSRPRTIGLKFGQKF